MSPNGRIESAMGIGNHSDPNGAPLVHGVTTGWDPSEACTCFASASTIGNRFLATIQSWLPSVTGAWAFTTADLTALTVEVTGPGIPSPITKRVELVDPKPQQAIPVVLDVPVGPDRVFTVSGLEEKGSSISMGQSSPTPLVAGQPATVDIALVALPFVTSVLPANSATDVAPSSQIQITFSKPMDANTITSETFKLQNSTGGVLGSRVSCNTPCTIATLTPLSPLAFDTSFTIVLGQGITDTTVPLDVDPHRGRGRALSNHIYHITLYAPTHDRNGNWHRNQRHQRERY